MFQKPRRTEVLRWCREGELNPQGTKYRRILSPLRLPVPPSRPKPTRSLLVNYLIVVSLAVGARLPVSVLVSFGAFCLVPVSHSR